MTRPPARAVLGLALGWGLLGWGAAAVLALQNDHQFPDALWWSYALRSLVIGAGAGGLGSPLLCAPLGMGWLPVQMPVRATLAGFMGMLVQRAVIGLVIGVIGTFVLLFVWPNEMQNDRLDALKWTGFFWTTHRAVMLPAAMGGGVLGGWAGGRLARG